VPGVARRWRGVLAGRRVGWRARVAGVLGVLVLAAVVAGRLADLTGAGPPDGPAGPLSGPGVLAGPSAGPGAGPVAPASPGATAGAAPGAGAGADGPIGPGASPYGRAAPPAATAAALAFVRAWLAPPAGTPASTWWQGVARHADPQLAAQLRLTDPERVPATRITGAPRSRHGGLTSAEVVVPTDAGEVLLLCTAVAGRWRVSDLDLDRNAR